MEIQGSLSIEYANLSYKIMSLCCLPVGCMMEQGLEKAMDWGGWGEVTGSSPT